jgi:mannose-6-phosphate isomerase-like protein (cupin superfamily)
MSRLWPPKEQLMNDKVNLAEKLARLDKPYVPGIVSYLNNYKVIVVKVLGEFVWHKHDDTDDFFLVLRGHLTIQLRDRNIELGEGEMFVVPRGVEHCPKADEEAHVLLIEPKETLNTGDAGGDLTAQPAEI